jgi:hypothetical protein
MPDDSFFAKKAIIADRCAIRLVTEVACASWFDQHRILPFPQRQNIFSVK